MSSMSTFLVQALLTPVLCIQSMMLLLHCGFILKMFSIDRAFKLILLRFMFAIELVPLYVAAFLTEPLSESFWFQIFIFVHLGIHTYQAIQVTILGKEPGIHIKAPFGVEVGGRMYVDYDTTVHAVNFYRLVLLSHFTVIWLAVAFGVSFVSAIPWDEIREDSPEQKKLT